MITPKLFVVIKGVLFYKSDKEFVAELDKAKQFSSKGTANKIAKRVDGVVRELLT